MKQMLPRANAPRPCGQERSVVRCRNTFWKLESDSRNLDYLKTFSTDRSRVARLAVLQWAGWNRRMRQIFPRANVPRPCGQERSVVRCRNTCLLERALAVAWRYPLLCCADDAVNVMCRYFIDMRGASKRTKMLLFLVPLTLVGHLLVFDCLFSSRKSRNFEHCTFS
jgi:hypothetical protein